MTPDMILCRSSAPVEADTKSKLGLFCQVSPAAVLSVHDVSNLYRVPLLLLEQGAPAIIFQKLKLSVAAAPTAPLLVEWRRYAEKVDSVSERVTIAIVGKYAGFQDSYQSVVRALQHSAIEARRKLQLEWINATDLEPNTESTAPEDYQKVWLLLFVFVLFLVGVMCEFPVIHYLMCAFVCLLHRPGSR